MPVVNLLAEFNKTPSHLFVAVTRSVSILSKTKNVFKKLLMFISKYLGFFLMHFQSEMKQR